MGSSPHTRDKFGSLYGGVINGRIIPAYAGQIPRICRISESLRDHPRIRGTNARLYLATAIGSGSSPHTRDKYDLRVNRRLLERIIPAYAGQMSLFRLFYRLLQDHPRIRGTNLSLLPNDKLPEGSSPHTRDKFINSFVTLKWSRIIPAYAGQIIVILGKELEGEDHPRIRGTNYPGLHLLAQIRGSSPHTRDK